MQGVRSSSLLGFILQKVCPALASERVHKGLFFIAKRLSITFRAQKRAQNFGVRALSGADAKNPLCIHLNDAGVGSLLYMDL